MNILVINGSPKGKNSITLQTVLYLQKKNPGHTFEILHAGQRIKALEKNFSTALEAISMQMCCCFPTPFTPSLLPVSCIGLSGS